jgi:hypothetical protein
MAPSAVFMLPFRFLLPPILETPLSAIGLPSTKFTVLLLILSFGTIVGGAVYCYVTRPGWMWTAVDARNRTQVLWLSAGISDQVGAEACVVGAIFALGGLSMIAAFYVLAAGSRRGLVHAYIYRFAFTFPVWAVMSFFVFKMKVTSWGLSFVPDRHLEDE